MLPNFGYSQCYKWIFLIKSLTDFGKIIADTPNTERIILMNFLKHPKKMIAVGFGKLTLKIISVVLLRKKNCKNKRAMERATRQHHCPLALRGAIVGQHLGGSSNSEISRSLNVSVRILKLTNYHEI